MGFGRLGFESLGFAFRWFLGCRGFGRFAMFRVFKGLGPFGLLVVVGFVSGFRV